MRGRLIAVICVPGVLGLGAAAVVGLGDAVQSGRAPDMAQVVDVAKRPMTTAPAVARAVELDGVTFPDWTRWGWTATGGRTDRFEERRTAAVMYEKGKQKIAYVIVSGIDGVNSLQPTRSVQRTPPRGKIALMLGGSGGGSRPSQLAEPAGAPFYLCGDPDACELSPAHLSVKRKVRGHTVALIGWPVSDELYGALQDMAVRAAG